MAARTCGMAANPIYLLLSHHHLDRSGLIRRIKSVGAMRFVCFVHDLIPIDYPEYGKARQTERHHRRVQAVADYADGVIVNSQSTAASLRARLGAPKRSMNIVTAPLGVELDHFRGVGGLRITPPYFVIVGTIEPKKNHLLLLQLWRQLVEQFGADAPRLVLVGQRGWKNQHTFDLLNSDRATRSHVIELSGLADSQLGAVLRSAQALLMPSLAEGYGLPVAEALALSVPVICSDIAALREVGGHAAEYLDPLDGPGWVKAILDYCDPDSARRQAQLSRITRWPQPTWAEHFAIVEPLIN